jgi:hypothetical protein
VPKVPELAEDLRLLAILNALQPAPEQWKELASVAATGKEKLAVIEAGARSTLDQQRAPLLAARELLLRGQNPPAEVDARLAGASQAAEAARAQKLEELIAALSARVGAVLTPAQARRVEEELAPVADQPWRRYARGPAAPALPNAARLPSDPARWVKELRDLRTLAVQGDPQRVVDAFAKKLAAGAKGGTPLSDQALAQARALAAQALALPPMAFAQREWTLARQAAKQELETRNTQRLQDGKPTLTFDAHRWLVEQVLLSPRAATVISERAANGE